MQWKLAIMTKSSPQPKYRFRRATVRYGRHRLSKPFHKRRAANTTKWCRPCRTPQEHPAAKRTKLAVQLLPQLVAQLLPHHRSVHPWNSPMTFKFHRHHLYMRSTIIRNWFWIYKDASMLSPANRSFAQTRAPIAWNGKYLAVDWSGPPTTN